MRRERGDALAAEGLQPQSEVYETNISRLRFGRELSVSIALVDIKVFCSFSAANNSDESSITIRFILAVPCHCQPRGWPRMMAKASFRSQRYAKSSNQPNLLPIFCISPLSFPAEAIALPSIDEVSFNYIRESLRQKLLLSFISYSHKATRHTLFCASSGYQIPLSQYSYLLADRIRTSIESPGDTLRS